MPGNLGSYESFTTAAKAAGGVEAHISNIERDAIQQALPKLLALGAAGGAIGLAALNKLRERRALTKAKAAESRQTLRRVYDEEQSAQTNASGDATAADGGSPTSLAAEDLDPNESGKRDEGI